MRQPKLFPLFISSLISLLLFSPVTFAESDQMYWETGTLSSGTRISIDTGSWENTEVGAARTNEGQLINEPLIPVQSQTLGKVKTGWVPRSAVTLDPITSDAETYTGRMNRSSPLYTVGPQWSQMKRLIKKVDDTNGTNREVCVPNVELSRNLPQESPLVTSVVVDKILHAGVPARPLQKALEFQQKNPGLFPNKDFLSILDFTKDPKEERWFVVNLKTGEVLKSRVAHGVGKPPTQNSKEATKYFGDAKGSDLTPAGFIRTAESYAGNYGVSLRLDGLEERNKNVRERAVVIHSNKKYDSLIPPGRSHGCAVAEQKFLDKVLPNIKGGSLVYNYAGD
ncbi:MAG: hypothetical protein BroJett040_06740 [Oligoflexia bacterium]|nr:MAG: hypothetical protein BroJett040_06740 [Oligoflexia bacterium]